MVFSDFIDEAPKALLTYSGRLASGIIAGQNSIIKSKERCSLPR